MKVDDEELGIKAYNICREEIIWGIKKRKIWKTVDIYRIPTELIKM